jgi:hypothetical protein
MHVPWPFVAVLLTFVLLGGAVSILNPLFESTDEIRHYRYIRYLVVEQQLPVQGAETVRSQSHHPPLYYALSALASAWVPSPHTPDYVHPINPFWGHRRWEVSVDNKLQYYHQPAEKFPFRAGYLAALIPRWVNVLLGAVTIWFTYRLGQRLWGTGSPLATGAAAFVAFNPQFVYLSGAMNNDILAAATGAAVLFLCVKIAQRGLERQDLSWLGVAYGLALLAKLHLLAMGGAIALALALGALQTGRGESPVDTRANQPTLGSKRWPSVLRRWLYGLGLVLLITFLISGWWFLRNWWLYGDPTALNKVNELWEGRPPGGNWWALQQGLPYLWSSLWGRFGYGQIPLPPLLYQALLIICSVALLGYLIPPGFRYVRRVLTTGRLRANLRSAIPVRRAGTWALLLLTLLGFTIIVFYYILIQPAGPMGRFLFPALPALATLLVGGVNHWLRRPAWTTYTVVAGAAILALVALGGYLWPAVRYPPRAAQGSSSEEDTYFQFADIARLLDVDVYPARVQPGEPLFVKTTWEPLRTTEQPFIVYVHLIDQADVLLVQRDTWPGLGRAPTTTWRPQQTFVDTYRLDLPETAYTPNQATVRLGLYEPTLGRLPVFDAEQQPVGDGVTAGTVTLQDKPGPWPNALNANFGNEIDLVGYEMTPRALRAGQTFTLTLYWRPRHQPQYDYMVFAQVLDPAYHVWGSQDGQGPDWVNGEVVQDIRKITLLPDTPPGSYPVQVGLFHSETGRLPVIAPEGHYLDERVLLGPIRVQE